MNSIANLLDQSMPVYSALGTVRRTTLPPHTDTARLPETRPPSTLPPPFPLPLGLANEQKHPINGPQMLQRAVEQAWRTGAQLNDTVLAETAPPGGDHEDAAELDAPGVTDHITISNNPVPATDFYEDRAANGLLAPACDLGILLRAASIMLVTMMLILFTRHAMADDMDDQTGRITVTGVGTATAAPDLAIITTGVITAAPQARDAVVENNTAMSALTGRLKAMGVEERDLLTSGFSISPQYERVRPREGQTAPPPRIVAYEVRNGLTVRVRDLEETGAILDAVVSEGGNQVNGISFSIDGPTQLMQAARRDAVLDARARAEVLADGLGVGLGQIISVSEGQAAAPRPRPAMARMEMAMAADAAPVPIEAGEQSLETRVTVTWELEQ